MKLKKALLTAGVLILILAAALLYWCGKAPFGVCTKIPSPNGDYTLEVWYTDIGAVGYRSRVYLAADGKRYFVERWGPGGVRWEDDRTIVLSTGSSAVQYRTEDILRGNP